jgi:hypothetical protein
MLHNLPTRKRKLPEESGPLFLEEKCTFSAFDDNLAAWRQDRGAREQIAASLPSAAVHVIQLQAGDFH